MVSRAKKAYSWFESKGNPYRKEGTVGVIAAALAAHSLSASGGQEGGNFF